LPTNLVTLVRSEIEAESGVESEQNEISYKGNEKVLA
jgi:hypothetical protein